MNPQREQGSASALNLLLIGFCLAIFGADFTQLATGGLAPGPLAGGVLYLCLAVGCVQRRTVAYGVILFMPVVPLVAVGFTALGVFHLTTPWTLPVWALQGVAAGLAGGMLWRSARSPLL
jgi:hypothetical protein